MNSALFLLLSAAFAQSPVAEPETVAVPGSAPAAVSVPGTAPVAVAEPVLKTIELEWEEVPNAESYILKLTPVGAPGAPIYFTAKEAKLVEKVPLGNYELRIRSRSKEEDVLSKWSDPIQLEVAIRETKPISPADKEVIEAKGKLTDSVEFSWTPVEKVKLYTITIWTNEIRDKPLTFTTKNTKKTLNVKTGRDYFWQVNFESATDISYAQMPPIFTFTLIGPKLITPGDIKVTRTGDTHTITWNKSEDAREYRTKLYFRFIDEKEFKPLKEVKLKEPQWNAGRLPAGVYKVEIIARAPQRVDSDAATLEFNVKPTEAQLLQR